MVIAVVALSTLGTFWVFLSLPIITTARDLFRYVLGRLEEPPRPAGVLPDDTREKDQQAITSAPLLAGTPVADPAPARVSSAEK